MPVRDLLMSAGGAGSPPVYVDDVFSTYLYTGTGATQSINNGIDFTKGGMTWIKSRSGTYNNVLFDTVRGANKFLISNGTNAQNSAITDMLTAFNTNGFSLGADASTFTVNASPNTYSSWSFRKQPKFFDIVTFSGTGSVLTVNHNLGSTPGCIIIKCTNNATSWVVYHKGLNGGTNPQNYAIQLQSTAAQLTAIGYFNNTAPTSTQFTVGTSLSLSVYNFVAYIFADQAGGFGASGTDSAIACGNFTTTSAGTFTSTLGWEPQYVMFKRADGTSDWQIVDVIRGFSQTNLKLLYADTSVAEADGTANPSYCEPIATGFQTGQAGIFVGSANYIYIAIRRPMKPPTTGTSVFSPAVATPVNPSNTVTTGFPVDLALSMQNSQSQSDSCIVLDRLRGGNTSSLTFMQTASPSAENTFTGYGPGFDNNTALVDAFNAQGLGIVSSTSYWNFKRAPTFFDEVCYTGTGIPTTINHNLTVAPELLITKRRDSGVGGNWQVYNKTIGNTNYLTLNATNASGPDGGTLWNSTSPTSTVFSIGTSNNIVSGTYVAYLFATCAGVSKVGSFTGTGGTQTINCGFGSGGARFILIKRTDASGNWYGFDSANGLTSSSSPYLLWNSMAAQTTGNNGVYASSGGFTLTSSASATVNINGGSYIFLAIS